VDIVIEATGRFRTRDAAFAHLTAGARKVVITAPGNNVDATIVLGVDDDVYQPDVSHIVSSLLHHQLPGADGRRATPKLRRPQRTRHYDPQLHQRPDHARRPTRTCAGPAPPPSTGAATAVGLVISELAGPVPTALVVTNQPNTGHIGSTGGGPADQANATDGQDSGTARRVDRQGSLVHVGSRGVTIASVEGE
jgi:hypothetical protein